MSGSRRTWVVGAVAALVVLGAALAWAQPARASGAHTAADAPAGGSLPPLCRSAGAYLAAGRIAEAFHSYVQALSIPASQGCAVAGLAALPHQVAEPGTAAQDLQCQAADALGRAGQDADARKIDVALLQASPNLSCARAGLLAMEWSQVATDCLVGQRLLDAHQYTLAVAQFQKAVATAGLDPAGRCGSRGLLAVQAAQDRLAPRLWDDWQGRVAQWGLGILWLLALVALAAFTVLIAAGWSVRLLNWIDPERLRPRLVPRVRLSALTGTIGDASGDSLTPLLRSEMNRVQTVSRVSLQFMSGASDVQNLVTAVKDVDARLGAWAQLASVFTWLWPWKTLVVQGQILPPGRYGAGVTLSIGTGARVPTAVTFWRHPPVPLSALPAAAPPPAAPATTAPATATPAASAQDYYDLIPAAATWAVYESARLSRSYSGLFTAAGAGGNGYLAASFRLPAKERRDAMVFLLMAQTLDPRNAGLRLSLLHRTPDVADKKCSGYLDILVSNWLRNAQKPHLDGAVWGLPHV